MARNRKARRSPGTQRTAVARREHTSEDRGTVVSAIVNGVVSLAAIGVGWWLVVNGYDVGVFLGGVAGLLQPKR